MKNTLRKIRLDAGMKQSEFAKILGYSHQVEISRLENGVRPITKRLAIIINLLDSKKVSVDDIKRL